MGERYGVGGGRHAARTEQQERDRAGGARIAETVRQSHLTHEEKDAEGDAELLAAAARLGIDVDPANLGVQRADGPEEVEVPTANDPETAAGLASTSDEGPEV